MNATVSISLSDLQELQTAKARAELEAAMLRQRLIEQKIESSNPALMEIAKAGIEIARFAVANLPAECTHGWPSAALSVIAKHLPQVPDTTTDHVELSTTFNIFARECEDFERRRQVISPVTV